MKITFYFIFPIFLFDRLFKTNANLKYIFAHFSKLETEDDMRENEALEHHATFVMTTLDEAISNIDNYNYVIDHLHRTGATHQRFIDFSSENFGVSSRWGTMVPQGVEFFFFTRWCILYVQCSRRLFKVVVFFSLIAFINGFLVA